MTNVGSGQSAATESPERPYGGSDPGSEVDLRELLRKLWRRKLVIVGTTVTLTVVTAIVVFQLTPRYTAAATVMIEPRKTKVIDIEAVMSGLPADLETIQSEVEVIRSRGLASRIVQELELENNPEFNPTLRPETLWDRYFDLQAIIPQGWFEILGGSPADDDVLSEEEKLAGERVRIIDIFLAKLKVSPVSRSRVIGIAFESEDPRTAAAIANKLTDLYLVQQLEAKYEATRRATAWLDERVGTLKEQVGALERAVETFRDEAGLIEGKGVTLASQELSELNTEFVLARSKRAEAEARLTQTESLLRSSGGADSVAEVLSSPFIQTLKEQQAEVVRKAAELSTEYGEKHPRMINIRAEMRDIEGKIASEVNKIFQQLRNEVAVARARERSLEESVKQLEVRVAQLNEKQVRLRALQREADTSRALYETFLSRFKEVGEEGDFQQTDTRVISRADVPTGPSFPKNRLMIAVAFVASGLLGVVLAFLIEQLDHGFRSAEQIERLTGLRSLGLIPLVRAFRKAPEQFIVEKPGSALGEAIRTLHTSLLLSNLNRRPKIALITSALPQEGKTVIALSLGRMVALAGHRCLVIDTDLRRPELSKKTGVPGKPGLVELLAGQASLEETVHRDKASGAFILAAGEATPNAADLLNSEQMRNLLDALSGSYDLIVLDSPPVLAVADARVLARLADKTIFVVRWAETRREVAMMAMKQIAEAGGDLAGVALSMVNVKKHARYSYADSGYYYGLSRKYYTS